MNIKFAELKISEVITEQSLRLDNSPGEFFKLRTKPLFTSIAYNASGEKLIFRFAFDHLITVINKEYTIYKMAREKNWDTFPILVTGELGDNFSWLCYKYIKGAPCGNVYQYDKNANFDLIIQKLWHAVDLDLTFSDNGMFLHRDKASWDRLFGLIVNKEPKALRGGIKQLYSLLIALPIPESKKFIHGDLHPGNVINSNNGIKIIDWEDSHFGCFGFDLSFLYIRSYNQDRRGQIATILMEKSREDKYGFYYSLGANLLRDYFEWLLIRKGTNELMNSSQIINNMTIDEIFDDLEQEINKTYSILKDWKR